jgi:hypothetical protein
MKTAANRHEDDWQMQMCRWLLRLILMSAAACAWVAWQGR